MDKLILGPEDKQNPCPHCHFPTYRVSFGTEWQGPEDEVVMVEKRTKMRMCYFCWLQWPSAQAVRGEKGCSDPE